METDYVEFRKPSYPPMEPGWHWYYGRRNEVSDEIVPVCIFVTRPSQSSHSVRLISHYGRVVPETEFTWFGPVHKIREG